MRMYMDSGHTQRAAGERLHMPEMRRTKRTKEETIQKALKTAWRVLLSVIASETAALMLIPAAYAERGYRAVGGEWLLIIAVGVLGYLAGGRRDAVQ